MITFGPIHPPTCSLTKLLPKNCFGTPSSNSSWIKSAQKLWCLYLSWFGLCFPEYNTFFPEDATEAHSALGRAGYSTLQLQGSAKWSYTVKPSWFFFSAQRLKQINVTSSIAPACPTSKIPKVNPLHCICRATRIGVLSVPAKKTTFKGGNPKGSIT